MKKILLMGHVDGLGGAQTALIEFYKFTIQHDYVVKVILITDDKINKQKFEKGAIIGDIPHKVNSKISSIIKAIHIFYVCLRTAFFKPDIFLTIGLSKSANIVAYFVGKECFKIGQDFIANRPVNDKLWRSSRLVLSGMSVQAPSMLNYWKSVGEEITNLTWLPCFPTPPAYNIVKENISEKKNNIRIAYFGRLASNKGLPMLLTAIKSVSSNYTISLDLWGKGDEEEKLKSMIKDLDLCDIVCLMGNYADGTEGAKLMISYDAIVLCSTRLEGLPLILIESMAYGIPFLATDIGAISDCCIDNDDAILVQPNQIDITNGLLLLFNKLVEGDFDCKRLRSYYERKFSYNTMADRWTRFLQNPKLFFNE